MINQRPERGHALFLSRDSSGQHEMALMQYVGWAQRETIKLGLSFSGTPEQIAKMIKAGCHAQGDLFLDYGVSGNKLSRPGLNAFLEAIRLDRTISHVFIPRPDRLARPNEPDDGVKLEKRIRHLGVTIVYQNCTLGPLTRGVRQNKHETLDRFATFDSSGRDRQELAQKMIWTQIQLAQNGYSIGGRAPYGFRRWLVDAKKNPVRQLVDGERVRHAGHHVFWLPVDDEHQEMQTIRRIVDMLKSMPACKVARILTNDGVPTPDAGRWRTDSGHKHETSGLWHATTITNIARNPLLQGLVVTGRRSMGDQLRFTPEGPRELIVDDFRQDVFAMEDDDDPKPKVIRNSPSALITSPASFEAVIDPEKLLKLNEELDRRAGTQKGKPRSRDPNNNPLGCRVFDMNCSGPMYRTTSGATYDYRCSRYTQSYGKECDHNRVKGSTATQVVLGAIGQSLLHPDRLARLAERLRQLVEQRAGNAQIEQAYDHQRAKVDQLKSKLDRAAGNYLSLESEAQRHAAKRAMDKIEEDVRQAESELKSLTPRPVVVDPAAKVREAVALLRRLPDLAKSSENLPAVRRLIELVDARLYLGFEKKVVGKRQLNRVSKGVLTFGAAEPPITVYQGPTARNKLPSYSAEQTPAESQVSDVCVDVSVGKDDSLRNANRGDRI